MAVVAAAAAALLDAPFWLFLALSFLSFPFVALLRARPPSHLAVASGTRRRRRRRRRPPPQAGRFRLFHSGWTGRARAQTFSRLALPY